MTRLKPDPDVDPYAEIDRYTAIVRDMTGVWMTRMTDRIDSHAEWINQLSGRVGDIVARVEALEVKTKDIAVFAHPVPYKRVLAMRLEEV